MAKKEMVIIAEYEADNSLSVEELCIACDMSLKEIQELMNFDIVNPKDGMQTQWRFNLDELERARVAKRLQRDLELNLAGVALVLQLREELNTLRTEMRLWEKHFLR